MFMRGRYYTIVVSGKDRDERWFGCEVIDFDDCLLKVEYNKEVRILSFDGNYFRYAIIEEQAENSGSEFKTIKIE